MNDQWLDEANEIAATVSRQVHKKYTTYFDKADVQQELIIWCLNHEDKVRGWLDPNQEPVDRKGGIKQLAKTMNREADKYCRSRKAKICGYDVRDDFFYSVGLLEELLPYVHDQSKWVGGQQSMNVRVSNGGSDPAEGHNYLAMMVDTKAAYEKLEPEDQLLITMRYHENLTMNQIANMLEIAVSTVSRRVNKALKRMVRELGGSNPWTGETYRLPAQLPEE